MIQWSRLLKLCLVIVLLWVTADAIAVFACGSLAPARFTNTIGFVSELEKDGKRIHLLGYQNTAQNKIYGGNALFLPIPAIPGTMSEKNIVDTSDISYFMDEMQRTVTKPLISPSVCSGIVFLALLALWFFFPIPGSNFLKKMISTTFITTLVVGLCILVGIGVGLFGELIHGQMASTPTQVTTNTNADTKPNLPLRQSASNTTVAPQGQEATYVTGVNTAGTIRVNNLANLAAILNAITSTTLIGGILTGIVLIVRGFTKKNFKASFMGTDIPGIQILAGIQLILVAFVFPIIINWLIASAYDAPLFGDPGEAVVFNSGIYTIVLASDVSQIHVALNKVPENKRPALNREFFNAYSKWYKGWTFALCCFDNQDALRATPMLWWYEPKYPDLMFFPALDAHTGKPPDLDAQVEVDHCLVVASDKVESFQDLIHMVISPWRDFQFITNRSAEKQTYIPQRIMGHFYKEVMSQGDFLFRIKDVRKGIFEPKRALPPGVSSPQSIWNCSDKG